MTWVLEQPLYIVILGGLTVAILAFGWMQTGYRAFLHATLGVIAVTAGLLLLERWVETDAEQVEATLRRIGKQVESNNVDAVLSYVYSGAPNTLREAASELPKYEFHQVDIKRNVEVHVDKSTQPPTATVTFNVVVDVTELETNYRDRKVPRFVKLTFRKEDGRWKVEKYAHYPPHEGMRLPDDS